MFKIAALKSGGNCQYPCIYWGHSWHNKDI